MENKERTIDILDDFIIFEEDISGNTKTNNIEKKQHNIFFTLFNYISFLIKYTLTSVLIFFLLLITTNYSAYLNIAKSYIYDDELKNNEKSLITSVEAGNLIDKEKTITKKDRKIERIEEIEEKIEEDKNNFHSINKLIAKSNKNKINLDIDITPYENRIIIPKIGKNIPLINIENKEINGVDELNNIFLKELKNGVIRYPSSSIPGELGSTFIFGHSSNFPWIKGDYNDVFALLDKVEFNDEIIVYYNQKKFKYKIREKKVIKPSNVKVLKRNKNKSEITIMTCRPIGTTLNRLIVVGDLVEEK